MITKRTVIDKNQGNKQLGLCPRYRNSIRLSSISLTFYSCYYYCYFALAIVNKNTTILKRYIKVKLFTSYIQIYSGQKKVKLHHSQRYSKVCSQDKIGYNQVIRFRFRLTSKVPGRDARSGEQEQHTTYHLFMLAVNRESPFLRRRIKSALRKTKCDIGNVTQYTSSGLRRQRIFLEVINVPVHANCRQKELYARK